MGMPIKDGETEAARGRRPYYSTKTVKPLLPLSYEKGTMRMVRSPSNYIFFTFKILFYKITYLFYG